MKKSIGAKPVAFPAPVWCIGTYDVQGKPNVMAVAWGGICCSEPPCVTISVRKATYTYGNLMGKKAYTISIPSEKYVKEADYFGIASGHKTDKFKDANLTPEKSAIVDAPFVKEFPMVLECKVIHHYEIGLHTQFIGEIMDIKIEEDMITDGSKIDIEKIRPITFSPLERKYHGIGEYLGRAFEIGKKL